MLWGVISLAMVIVFNLFSQPQHSSQPSVTYSEFLRQAAKGEVSEVVIQGNTLTGKTTDGKSFQIYVPNDPGLVDKLIAEKVEVRAEPVEDSPWYMTLLVSWFPMLLLIGVWIFFMRQMQGGAGRAMSFGRSRARMLNQEQGKVTFDDVAGVDEAKEELSEVVDFLSNPRKFFLTPYISTRILWVAQNKKRCLWVLKLNFKVFKIYHISAIIVYKLAL